MTLQVDVRAEQWVLYVRQSAGPPASLNVATCHGMSVFALSMNWCGGAALALLTNKVATNSHPEFVFH